MDCPDCGWQMIFDGYGDGWICVHCGKQIDITKEDPEDD